MSTSTTQLVEREPRRIIETIVKGLLRFGEGVFLRDHPLSRWLVFIAVITLLTTTVVIGSFRIKSSNYDRTMFNSFYKKLTKMSMPSYKTKMFFKRISSVFQPEKDEPTSVNVIDRGVITGRCDNLTMREGKIAGSGMCINTVEPKPIRWIIDPDSMPDYDKMNEATKKLLMRDGGKYIVIIPWSTYSSDGMYYYPDCSKAHFVDGTSAKYLFESDDVHSCTKRRIPRTKSSSQKRNILENWTSLTDYI